MGTTTEDVKGSQTYTIAPAQVTPELSGSWDGPAWNNCSALEVKHFHPNTLSRHPRTQAKVLYDQTHLYVHFRVQDQHVYSIYTNYQDNVCRDSCVEFFVQPVAGQGYFNFEINCGGAMLLYYVNKGVDAQGEPVRADKPVPWSLASQVRIYHSMPSTTPTPISTPMTWQIEYAIPFSLLEHYTGPVSRSPGSEWKANFYKCGGDPKYNHWASWAPIGPKLNFHVPEYFAPIVFG